MNLLTVRDVADKWKISTRHVWKLVSSGRLPQPVRLGRSVRWRESDIEKFVFGGCDMTQFGALTVSEGRAA